MQPAAEDTHSPEAFWLQWTLPITVNGVMTSDYSEWYEKSMCHFCSKSDTAWEDLLTTVNG